MTRFSGRKVLVLEDEAMVSLLIEDLLLDLGCEVLGPCMRISEANRILDSGATPDVALLDVNVAGERSFPLAERLSRANVAILFVTGYDSAGMEPRWRDHPALRKPFTHVDFESMVTKLLAGGTA